MQQTMETGVMALAFALLLVSMAVRGNAAMASAEVITRMVSGENLDR